MMTERISTINNEYVTIRQSPIHGLGIFAVKNIKKMTKIADYYGEEMSWKQFKSCYGKYSENSLYTYPMRRQWKIIVAKEEPYKTHNLVNYINENIGYTNCCLRKKALYAMTDILEGEELFLFYPRDYQRYWENELSKKQYKEI
jgi:SET domain-containing protein